MISQQQKASKLFRTRLTACIVALLGVSAVAEPAAAVTTWDVGLCGDRAGKAFTLRIAINHASDGDVINMAALPTTCSTIALDSEIPITVNGLSIIGPTDRAILVDGGGTHRIFNHSGSGTLTVSNVTLVNGHTTTNGGCVYSNGSVYLKTSGVDHCYARRNGGGIFTASNTSLVASRVTHNSTDTSQYSLATGGGIYAQANVFGFVGNDISYNQSNYTGGVYAKGSVTMGTSSIRFNAGTSVSCGAIDAGAYLGMTLSYVSGNTTGICGQDTHLSGTTITGNSFYSNLFGTYGDGVYTQAATIKNSTITGSGRGLVTRTSGVASAVTVSNSTISGNPNAGIYANNAVLAIHNSTIAFNGDGVRATLCDLNIESSIVADNVASDVDASQCNASGSHDLIEVTNKPFSNLITGNPKLAPLGYRGGPVPTHAILGTSPAIDKGSNTDGLLYDERGAGFARLIGVAVDIGAYERLPDDDELFYDGFE